MLDLDNPQTKHIFHASFLLGSLQTKGGEISRSNSQCRYEIYQSILPLLEELRQLNKLHFEDGAFNRAVVEKIDAALACLRDMGNGQIVDGDGISCPVCGQKLENIATPSESYCMKCLKEVNLFVITNQGFGVQFI